MELALHRQPGGDGDAAGPGRLTIKVKANTGDIADLVKLDLAGKPFIRDLINGRMLIFWEMTTEAGITLALRPGERFEDFEKLARDEFRFVMDELAIERGKQSAEANAAWSTPKAELAAGAALTLAA